MAGLFLLWLVMEQVCGNLREKNVALFSDNSPTVGWVRRLDSRVSGVSPPYTGTSPPAQTKRHVPNHTTPYCRRRELYDGYPIAVLWKRDKVALQIKLGITNIV